MFAGFEFKCEMNTLNTIAHNLGDVRMDLLSVDLLQGDEDLFKDSQNIGSDITL